LKVTKKKNGKAVRREWTKADIKELKAHSKARTPVAKISKETKSTIGALRQRHLYGAIIVKLDSRFFPISLFDWRPSPRPDLGYELSIGVGMGL
jgi:hypothetical protein